MKYAKCTKQQLFSYDKLFILLLPIAGEGYVYVVFCVLGTRYKRIAGSAKSSFIVRELPSEAIDNAGLAYSI